MVRSTFALGKLKVKFLNDLPCVLARLHAPGVRDRCVMLFKYFPEAAHDEVTLRFLKVGSRLRAAVDAMAPDG
eukprot:3114446-Pyramimonas_sp.AAC.1